MKTVLLNSLHRKDMADGETSSLPIVAKLTLMLAGDSGSDVDYKKTSFLVMLGSVVGLRISLRNSTTKP